MQDYIHSIYEFFKGNPIFNIISLILAIIGIVLTLYFYSKSKKNREPTYVLRTINLVKSSIKKIETVEILFSGRKIENLSISKVAFWNDGKETINAHNIAVNDPLRFVIDNQYEILDAEIILQKNPANDFKIKLAENKKSILIDFDYIDFEEGIVLLISHTGNSSTDIQLIGTIKTVKKHFRREPVLTFIPPVIMKILKSNDKQLSRKSSIKIFGWLALFMGIFIIFFPGLMLFPVQAAKEPSLSSKVLSMILGIPYIWVGLRLLRRNIPKGFDIFNEEF